MIIQHPNNLKEKLIMSLPNALVMVLFMLTINLWIFNSLTLSNWLIAFPLILITAVCLDFFCMEKISMYIANRYNILKYLPLYRVALLAGTLTFIAPIVESFGENIISLSQYLHSFPRNYTIALIVQVFLAFPLGNLVLTKYKLRH